MNPADAFTDFGHVTLPQAENRASRRYLDLVLRWIPVGRQYFNPWQGRPRCGHFFGGVYWYGGETAMPMEAFAFAASSPDYDASVAGISAEEAREMALQALRYLCFVHDTGPEDCVRPRESWGRPEPAGTKWGERGQGFFRESQCGHTVGALARTAALVFDLLGQEERSMLAAIAADYLDRFGMMEPRSGVYADTQMEENAWTAEGLTASLLLLPGHPQWDSLWENARLWMFRTATRPQDVHDYALFAQGKTVRDLCGRSFTTLPDGTAENHYIVHPGYMMSCVTFSGLTATMLRLFGQDAPEELWWHRRDTYDLLKAWADDTGALHPVQGMDWPYLSYPSDCLFHAVGAELLRDPEAALLEERSLSTVERAMAAHAGRVVPESILAHCHSIQDPAIMSERSGANLARCYLVHRLGDGGPRPAKDRDFDERLRGVHLYLHGGALLHRHPRGKTSFAWRNNTMVLPNTSEGLRLVGPAAGSLLARVYVRDRAPSARERLLRLREGQDRVAALFVEDLCQDSLRRQVLFCSLPDGRCLTAERLVALEDVTVERVEQGTLEVMNDPYFGDYPDLRGHRRLYWAGGERELLGYASSSADEDEAIPLEGGWLNVDDRLGLVFAGSGRSLYTNRHLFRPWHAVADLITLSLMDEPRPVRAGETVAQLAALWCPEEDHHQTGRRRLEVKAWDRARIYVMVDGFACLCNLAPDEVTFSVEGVAVPLAGQEPAIRALVPCQLGAHE
ncbi:MAG: hypothetical protein HPY83_11085 [Anaerolineae bacterium]|nr:hypothetical protein [Anaerolineae bacterium]